MEVVVKKQEQGSRSDEVAEIQNTGAESEVGSSSRSNKIRFKRVPE